MTTIIRYLSSQHNFQKINKLMIITDLKHRRIKTLDGCGRLPSLKRLAILFEEHIQHFLI